MRLSPPGTDFTTESTEAMRIKRLAQGHNILLPGFEPSTSVSRNRHSSQTTNMLRYYVMLCKYVINYVQRGSDYK